MDIPVINPAHPTISALGTGSTLHATLPDFRLERMVLIDSYAPGGEVIVDLANGAIVTGENGVGKTSLIRLVPIFFGENPSYISVGTESFSDFYLARSTSYIAFEYRRRDMLCLAVLCANSEGAFSYRFIRGAYDLAYFSAADGKTLVQSNALGTHLKTLGVIHSRALGRSEYQAVIQGRLTPGKDANNQRGMILDYAFTAGNHRLDHIDKIVGGMFRRQADFKDFLRMTVSYISSDDKAIALSGDRSRVAKWPEHFAVYQEVMRYSGRMDELTALGAKLTANQKATAALHARLLLLRDHLSEQAARLDEVHEEDRGQLATAEETHTKTLGELQQKAANAAASASLLEDQIRVVNEQDKAYADDDIQTKLAIVNALAANKTELDICTQRKRTLIGAQGEIEGEFSRLKLEVEAAFVRHGAAANQSKETISTSFAPRFEALNCAYGIATEQLREKVEGERVEIQEQLNAAIQEKAVFDATVANPPADPLLVGTAEEKRERYETAVARSAEAAAASEAAGRARQAANGEFEQQEAVVTAGERAIAEQEAAVAALLETATPAAGSLLRFLREHKPGWTSDIAKVIDPALLQRADLSPAAAEDATAVFGLSLDLSRIASPLFADEAAIQEAIAGKEALLGKLRAEHRDAGDELERRGRTRQEASEQHALRQSEEQNAKGTATTLKTEVELANRQVRESKADAATAAKKALSAVVERINGGNRALAELQRTLKDALGEAAKQHKNDVEKLEASRATELAEVGRALVAAEKAKAERLQAIDQDRLSALAAKGIDSGAVSALDRQLEELGTAIANAEAWSETVLKWKLWRKTQWDNLPKLGADAKKLRGTEAHFTRQVETKNRTWNTYRSEIMQKLGRMAAGAKEAREKARQAEVHLQSVNDYPADADVIAGGYEMVWTLDSLGATKIAVVAERGQLMAEIRTRVREIKNAFRKGHDSPVEQYFETIEAEIDPDDDDPAAWIEPLRKWYSGRHEEFLRTLLLEAQSFGRLINRFHADIVDFDRKVGEFNRRIREALRNTLHFERISNIDITFLSTIDQKAYWKPIEEFIEKHRTWINGIGRELPPASFSHDLRSLMEHWEIKAGISAERLALIDVRGEVVENGRKKVFSDAKGLRDLSSNGLSYLILTTISVAFLRMIRGNTGAQLTMAVDELLDLDVKNIGILVKMLRDNGIDLVSACPDADADVMVHFPNRYRVIRDERGPELQQVALDDEELLYV